MFTICDESGSSKVGEVKICDDYMPGNRVSLHPLETLNGARSVQGVRYTLAWVAEELSFRRETMVL